MKVTFLVCHLKSGGAEHMVSRLASSMAERGWQIAVLSLSGAPFYPLSPKVKLRCPDIPDGPAGPAQRLLRAGKRRREVIRFLREERPDAVFCMLPPAAKYLLGSPVRRNFCLLTSERSDPAHPGSGREKWLRDRAFAASDGIVFQTRRAMEYFPPDIRKKGRVIPNGVEAPVQAGPAGERRKTVLAVGRLEAQKDYPTLLRAFAQVRERHPGYTLEICGDGSRREELLALGRTLGLGESLCLRGVCPEPFATGRDAACYVLSSLYEGMPNALLEAMAAGMPCVAADCPNGPAELITSGENGLLVPVGDADALAQAILRMVEDRPFAERCGTAAGEILKTHGLDAVTEEYCRFLEAVCQRRKRR